MYFISTYSNELMLSNVHLFISFILVFNSEISFLILEQNTSLLIIGVRAGNACILQNFSSSPRDTSIYNYNSKVIKENWMEKFFSPCLILLKFVGFISAYDQKHMTGVVKLLLKQFAWIVEFIDSFPDWSWMYGYSYIVIRSYWSKESLIS